MIEQILAQIRSDKKDKVKPVVVENEGAFKRPYITANYHSINFATNAYGKAGQDRGFHKVNLKLKNNAISTVGSWHIELAGATAGQGARTHHAAVRRKSG